MSTTEARINANRLNALKSTGPRSEEGKAQSRQNALKHGLTAKQLVLPTEDTTAFEERREEWFDAYQPDGPAQKLLLARAVQASWRLDRCSIAETARLSERVLHAADDFERAACDRAEELGRRLLHEPCGPGYKFLPDEVIWNRIDRRAVDHPAILVRALSATAQGVDWLLAQWERLSETLKTFGKWQAHEAYAAARLLGRRPEDSTDDPIVGMLIINGLSAQPGEVHVYNAFDYPRLMDPGRPLDQTRLKSWQEKLPTFAKDALATLQSLISTETTRLRALKSEYLDALAAIDRANAVSRAHFDDSHAAVLSRRYETACERELRRAMSELCPPRPAQRGARQDAEAAALIQPPQPSPPAAVAPPVENEPEPPVRNEPKPTPVRRRMVESAEPPMSLPGAFRNNPSATLPHQTQPIDRTIRPAVTNAANMCGEVSRCLFCD
jgi:hypothetical protein